MEPYNLRRNLDQAMNSVRLLKSERDLHQIAMIQWITGQFTLIDSIPEEGGATIEAWFFSCPNRSSKEIVIILARGRKGIACQTYWAEEWLTHAASSECDNAYIRVAERIIQYRDRVSRSRQERQ